MKKISALLILVALLAGCATSSDRYRAEDMTSLEVAAVLKFSDLPIPNGFNLLANESFAFQNNELRIALLKYTGKGSAENIASFFKEQMPLYSWEIINIVEYGNNVLNFQRRDEICTITVTPQGSRSQLVISVAPRANLTSIDSTETFVK